MFSAMISAAPLWPYTLSSARKASSSSSVRLSSHSLKASPGGGICFAFSVRVSARGLISSGPCLSFEPRAYLPLSHRLDLRPFTQRRLLLVAQPCCSGTDDRRTADARADRHASPCLRP